jgi:hypothetical protein
MIGNRKNPMTHRCGDAAKGNSVSLKVISDKAQEYAESLRDVIKAIRGGGYHSLNAIASELNNRGIPTPRKRQWYPCSVRNLLARIAG